MVHREGVLQPVGGDVATCPEPSDVVDKDIQARARLEDLCGQAAHFDL